MVSENPTETSLYKKKIHLEGQITQKSDKTLAYSHFINGEFCMYTTK